MGRIAQALRKATDERLRMVCSQAAVEPRSDEVCAPGDSPHGSRLQPGSALRDTEPGERRAPGHQSDLATDRLIDVNPLVVAIQDRSSSTAEQYRAARTWLLRKNAAGKRTCVALTSSVPREGKSVTTANLAAVMAEVRHLNILAVDCDFRQGTLGRLMKVRSAPGFADVLAGRVTLDEAIVRTPCGNLSILPAGDCQGSNPAELLSSKIANRTFDDFRERFHYVLVDTPPVQQLSDVGIVGALCSGIIMVVRMGKTPSNLVRQSVHWLRSNNLDVMGCLATDCAPRAARYEYQARDEA